MEIIIEEILIYGSGILLCILVIFFYLKIKSNKSKIVEEKIIKAKEEGIYEPVTLYPFINPDICIGGAACVAACPEKDIIGIVNGKGVLINASNCVGHGACFHACPVEAISLRIGTEKRGVDIPHVNQHFETNVTGIYIAGELGGMGLIKNSVEQGKQATENIYESIDNSHTASYDLIIIGAGPAGISASLQAKKRNMKFLTLEQDSLGGTVFSFPRSKIVMTSPMDLPGYGKVKLTETSKTELLNLWKNVIDKNGITIQEYSKVRSIEKADKNFIVFTESGNKYITHKVLLAIGRRGSPRKLNVPGEELEKVAYRLLEPELILNKNILIVGGGDSAVESALLLASQNKVTLSYRNENFNRLKPQNLFKINEAIKQNLLTVEFSSVVNNITTHGVELIKNNQIIKLDNDLVYIFVGGELPTEFLEKSGIEIVKRFGYTVKSKSN